MRKTHEKPRLKVCGMQFYHVIAPSRFRKIFITENKMEKTIQTAVSLKQFLDVARDKGAHPELLSRASEFIHETTVQASIKDIANFTEKPTTEIAAKQLSSYLNISSDNMPPLDISPKPEL